VRCLLALAAAAACTKAPSPCARQVEELREWLVALSLDGPPAPVQHGLHLVSLADPAAHTAAAGATVAIASTGAQIALPAATPWNGAALRVITSARAGAVHLTSGH